MDTKINTERLIELYENGESLYALANMFGTYPMTVKRILERNNILLRHDKREKGVLKIEKGEELITWAKAQGRLVTKTELAKIAGTKRLSPSYFKKYPELGQYVYTHKQNELHEYHEKLYNWLKNNHILYKPNDKTKFRGVTVDALLLGEYNEEVALQISIKPSCISKQKHKDNLLKKSLCAEKTKTHLIFLSKDDFEDLDCIKGLLDGLKYSKER